jgi:hypothetical protein
MASHIVKINIEMTFAEMDGTPEQSALIALDFLEEAFSKYDQEFTEFYAMNVSVEECYEIDKA